MKKLLLAAVLCSTMGLCADAAKDTALASACCRDAGVAAEAACECPEGCKCDKCEACKENAECSDADACKKRNKKRGEEVEAAVEYVLDADGNPVLDDEGNKVVKPAAEEAAE